MDQHLDDQRLNHHIMPNFVPLAFSDQVVSQLDNLRIGQLSLKPNLLVASGITNPDARQQRHHGFLGEHDRRTLAQTFPSSIEALMDLTRVMHEHLSGLQALLDAVDNEPHFPRETDDQGVLAVGMR
jgi:hypothetical protein